MLLSLALAVVMAAGTDAPSLLNPDFTSGLDGWQNNAPQVHFEAARDQDVPYALIRVPDEIAPAYPMLYQEMPAQPGDLFEVKLEAAGTNVRDGYGVYAALEYWDAANRISFSQTSAARDNGAWTPLQIRSVAPANTTRIRLGLLLNGHGEARFRQVQIRRLDQLTLGPLDGPVTLTVDGAACPAITGFGAEDDGWFQNEENAERGVTEEDVRLREARITWMEPDWIRMFCWYKDWNPSGDWTTFTFDSPNMLSHYHALDVYQRLGAVVNIVGVEWGVQTPYRDPVLFAKAIGALFEHLIRERGYTCVQEWTLSNEPNGAFASSLGGTFAQFVELHLRVKEEFARRGLPVRIVGSDDTSGLTWFTQCVEDASYYDAASVLASHQYMPFADRVLAPFFFEERMSLLEKKPNPKPLIIAEFGFQDSRSGTFENPIMETYPYALWTSAYIIQGMNRGIAGFSIWCLHEVLYPGRGFMNYALWDYKEENWRVRPVYYAFANFTRLTHRGDPVRKCVSSHPGHVLGTVINNTLFWVNLSGETATVQVAGIPLSQVRIYTESTLAGDRECGQEAPVSENQLTLPPQSFGYAR